MYEIACLDEKGNQINYLTQWDQNQKYIVEIEGLDLTNAPSVHFANKSSISALIVDSEVSEGKIISKIPDELLQFAEPIYAYIYLSQDEKGSKTVAITKIPVRKRAKPANYQIKDIISQQEYDFIFNQFGESINDVEDMKTQISSINVLLDSFPEVAELDEFRSYIGI